jgi:hypothetical protein
MRNIMRGNLVRAQESASRDSRATFMALAWDLVLLSRRPGHLHPRRASAHCHRGQFEYIVLRAAQ